MKTKMDQFYLILAFLLGLLTLSADQVELEWDPNPETDIARYHIRYGTSPGSYSNLVDAGPNTSVIVKDLVAGKTYHFVAQAINMNGVSSPFSTELTHWVEKPSPWGATVKWVDDEDLNGYAAALAIDGDPDTFWHTTWREGEAKKPMPHEIQIDMNRIRTIGAFTYLPRQDAGQNAGSVKDYDFYVSLDGLEWGVPVSSGTLSESRELRTVSFPARSARYFRLVIKSEITGSTHASIAEINVIDSEAILAPSQPKGLKIKKR